MINFWNGNKSPIRQDFELKVLQLVIKYGEIDDEIKNDLTDYPIANDEGQIFNKGADVLVTVAGNKKFSDGEFLMLPQPLCKGLLGCRVLIVHKDCISNFEHITEHQFKQLKVGIPATWADADLFRANQYHVIEQGSLEERLAAVQNKQCDYVALGANEAQEVLRQFTHQMPDLVVEPNILLYYPFPLVFYCHPKQHALLQKITDGLTVCRNNGQLDQLFKQIYGADIAAIKLAERCIFHLTNPILPAEFSHYRTELLPT